MRNGHRAGPIVLHLDSTLLRAPAIASAEQVGDGAWVINVDHPPASHRSDGQPRFARRNHYVTLDATRAAWTRPMIYGLLLVAITIAVSCRC